MLKSRTERLFKKIPTLTTDRLVLRRIAVSDYKDMYEYSRLPQVTKYLLWSEHPSEQYTYEYLQRINSAYKKGDFCDWAVTLSDSGKMIGTCGFTSFDYENDRAEVGYVLNPAYWGQGIATEAVMAVMEFGFKELGANRIEAHFIEGNNASLRVMEKCGMRFEGMLRQYMLVKGEYKNIGFAAVTRDSFVPKNRYKWEKKGLFWF